MPDRDKLSWAKGLKGFLRRSRSQPPVADPPTNTTSVRQSTVTAPLADAQQTAHATPHSTATKHTNEHTEKYGLFPLQPTIIASGDDEDGMTNLIDIVAVHGITGDALNTWTHNNGNLWLRDLIPEAFPGVRVFSYGYPADVFCTFNVGTLDTYARSLLEGLKRERRNKKNQTRPIIFIFHSMGGIVALVIAKIEDELFDNIRKSVTGILFLSTPHRGSSQTQFPVVLTRIANVALSGSSRFVGAMRSDLIKALEKDSKILKDISTDFRNQTRSIKIASFIEQSLTPPANLRIVDEISGVMDISNERIIPMQGYDHRSICRFTGATSEGYKFVLDVLQDWIEELNQLNDEAITSEDLSCLRSLAFPEITYRRQEADRALLHACKWILQHKSYLAWLSKERELLWIKGKPGAGKSTLMAFIYQAFQENILSKQSLILDFFFHGRGTPLQKTPVGMFRSLLHQLYTKVPLVRPPVLAAFKEKRGFGEVGIGWQWQRKELEDLFSMAVIHAAKYRTITIFVDALDEAGSDTANELAVYFHDLNVKFADRKCSARICISCRHYPILAANTSLDVCLEDENHDDIVQYVKHRFETGIPRQEMATLSAGECQLLEEIIVKKASGVFQWARLVVSVIISLSQQGESLSYINQELGKVPPDLGDVYEHILKMVIEPRNWAKTLHLMQWVCLAERPLSVTELRFAMASDDIYIHQSRQFCKDAKDFVDTDSRMEILITSWSGGLLEVKHQETQTTVQFIHQSVNDFLLSDGLKYLTSLSNNRLPQDDGESTTVSTEIFLGQSHNRLCKSCVNCLRLEEVILSSSAALRGNEVKSHFREKLPFIFYATNSWFLHAEKAERFGNLQQDLVQQFGFSLGPAFQAWLKNFHALDYWNEKRPELDSTLLHIASSSDLRSVAQILLLNSSTNVHTEDNAGNRALHYAACWGHTELVKILLDAGADIGAKNKNGNMALDRAAANGHQDALQLLLCQGADVDTQGRDFGTALQEASFGGHDAIVGLLLEKGADVNAQDGDFGTALQAASFGGHDAIVGWLIAKGADVNAQGGFFGTALQEASFRGYDAIVGLLLEKGADVNAQGRHFGTALQAASFRGHDAIVGRLIEKGADVNAQGGFFGTALQEASFKWYDGIVERLLEKGASQSQ